MRTAHVYTKLTMEEAQTEDEKRFSFLTKLAEQETLIKQAKTLQKSLDPRLTLAAIRMPTFNQPLPQVYQQKFKELKEIYHTVSQYFSAAPLFPDEKSQVVYQYAEKTIKKELIAINWTLECYQAQRGNKDEKIIPSATPASQQTNKI